MRINHLQILGADMRLGVGVEGFERGDDGWVRNVVTDAGAIPADVVVLGLGVRPNVALARDAGITIGASGAIATDASMATSVPGIWAAGDCAESYHRVTKRAVSIALGTHANKQGRVVGINVSGGRATFPGVIGTAITKVSDIEIGRTGLNEREAAAAGIDAVAAVIEGSGRAHYYPDAEPLTVKVVAERGSGRMIGAQIVGGSFAAKRIDALAVAHLERDDCRRLRTTRPRVRATVLAGVGPDAHRGEARRQRRALMRRRPVRVDRAERER